MSEVAVDQEQQFGAQTTSPWGHLADAGAPSSAAPVQAFAGDGGGSTEAINAALGHYADDGATNGAPAPKETSWFDKVKDFGSSAIDTVTEVAKPVTDTVSSLQDMADSTIHSATDFANDNIDKGEAAVTDGVAHSKDKDNWVGSLVNELGGFAGGVGKELVRVGGGVANMVVHPLDTAASMYGMAEHIPGVGTPLKALHAGYDMVANGETAEGAAARLDPVNSLKDDYDYGGNLVHGMVNPIAKSWEQGKYGEAVGQAATQVFMMVGGGGASKVGEAAEAGEAAEVAKIARQAQKKRVQMPAVENPYGPKPPGWEATPFPGPAKPGGPLPKPAEFTPVKPAPKVDPALAPTQPGPAFAPTEPAIPVPAPAPSPATLPATPVRP